MPATEAVVDWSDEATSAFDVEDGEFVVVSADESDIRFYTPLCGLLARVRKAFGIEALFVAQWYRGEPMVRAIIDVDAADLLESTCGRRLLEAADPAPNRVFEACPVITHDGQEHGTLCCLGAPAADAAAQRLRQGAMRSVARLIADWLEDQDVTFSGFGPLKGASTLGELMPA